MCVRAKFLPDNPTTSRAAGSEKLSLDGAFPFGSGRTFYMAFYENNLHFPFEHTHMHSRLHCVQYAARCVQPWFAVLLTRTRTHHRWRWLAGRIPTVSMGRSLFPVTQLSSTTTRASCKCSSFGRSVFCCLGCPTKPAPTVSTCSAGMVRPFRLRILVGGRWCHARLPGCFFSSWSFSPSMGRECVHWRGIVVGRKTLKHGIGKQSCTYIYKRCAVSAPPVSSTL